MTRSYLWSAFERDALCEASLENILLEPGIALRATVQDPAHPGLLVTAPIQQGAFDCAIVSWNALTPPGTWLELDLRASIQDRWTRFYPLALWSSCKEGPRRSCPGHGDEDGSIDTDTFRLPCLAEALQIRVRLVPGTTGVSPTLTGLTATLSDSHRKPIKMRQLPSNGGLELDVPQSAQGDQPWCSPACVTMVLEYWGMRLGKPLADALPLAAQATWDSAYEGAGNWPFNTAYASTKGLRAYVAKLAGLAEAERFLRRGVPLVLSIAWGGAELPGAHLPASKGHLVVLRGFNRTGDPILNDPAAPEDARVRTEYPRNAFEKAWVRHSGGIAYVIEP